MLQVQMGHAINTINIESWLADFIIPMTRITNSKMFVDPFM